MEQKDFGINPHKHAFVSVPARICNGVRAFHSVRSGVNSIPLNQLKRLIEIQFRSHPWISRSFDDVLDGAVAHHPRVLITLEIIFPHLLVIFRVYVFS